MKRMLAASLLTIVGALSTGNVAADTSKGSQEEFITVQQQQELIDWSMKSQAALTKRLDTKLHNELTSMLYPADGSLDMIAPEIDVPEQELICAGKPEPVPSDDNGILVSDCYVATP